MKKFEYIGTSYSAGGASGFLLCYNTTLNL